MIVAATDSPRRAVGVLMVLGMLTALGPLTTDLYLPAFPSVRADLGASASLVQLTLTTTTVGLGVGQLITGPWSDRVGRRLPLFVAGAFYLVASIGVAVSPSVDWLIGFRLAQGLGASGTSVIALAIVRDLFAGRSLIAMLARLALITGLAPILAPVIGSQLLAVMHWRGIFVCLVCFAAAALVAAAIMLPESIPPEHRLHGRKTSTVSRYRTLFRDRVYLGATVVGATQYAALFAYLSASSFLLQDTYGLSVQQYGIAFAANSLALAIGTQISSRILRRHSPERVLTFSLIVLGLAAASVIVGDLDGVGLPGLMVSLCVFMLGCGFGFPCSQVLALGRHPDEAGTAASFAGFLYFALAGAVAPLVGAFSLGSAIPMGAIMLSACVVANLAFWTLVWPRMRGMAKSSLEQPVEWQARRS